MVNRPNREVSKHPTRVSLEDSQGRGRLNVQGMEEGYAYCVANDRGGRVNQLKQQGYEVVEHNGTISMGDSADKQVGTAVTTTADSKDGTKAVLMRCPQAYRDEDDAFRQKQIDQSEEALFRNAKDEKGRYGKIEVS